mmetsp:Transcript_19033/g.47281  ORF Transcript_19033/g.47281 Transcript_19033/m.47281 type:complete len:209 (-) Transcript_19033:287-913(-)
MLHFQGQLRHTALFRRPTARQQNQYLKSNQPRKSLSSMSIDQRSRRPENLWTKWLALKIVEMTMTIRTIARATKRPRDLRCQQKCKCFSMLEEIVEVNSRKLFSSPYFSVSPFFAIHSTSTYFVSHNYFTNQTGATRNSCRTSTRSGSRSMTRKKSVRLTLRVSSRRFRGDAFRRTSSTPTCRPCARKEKTSCGVMECSTESFTDIAH